MSEATEIIKQKHPGRLECLVIAGQERVRTILENGGADGLSLVEALTGELIAHYTAGYHAGANL